MEHRSQTILYKPRSLSTLREGRKARNNVHVAEVTKRNSPQNRREKKESNFGTKSCLASFTKQNDIHVSDVFLRS